MCVNTAVGQARGLPPDLSEVAPRLSSAGRKPPHAGLRTLFLTVPTNTTTNTRVREMEWIEWIRGIEDYVRS